MQINQLKPVFIGFFILLCSKCHCQNDITAGGGTLASESAIISYSIGQVSYQIISSTQTELSQGVQQAFEISAISGVKSNDQKFEVSVFPNPTTDYITIQFESLPKDATFMELRDLSGKLLFSKNILSKSSQIPFHSLSSGVYFLTLKTVNRETQSFKIVKNR